MRVSRLGGLPPGFAFLVHPRDTRDLERAAVGTLLRRYSSDREDFLRRVNALPPLVVGDVRFGFAPVRGELICAPRLPERIMMSEGRLTITRAAAVAAARGARVIGLGGLTAPAMAGGSVLLKSLPPGVTVTNGNALTAAVVRRNVVDIVARCASGSRVAIVGCTGSVGTTTSRLVAAEGFDLLLIGRTAERARTTVGPLPGAQYSGDLQDLRRCGAVVLLTNDPAATVQPTMLARGTVVVDAAQPKNIAWNRRDQFRQRDVQVLEGGLVRIPGYRCTYDLGLAGQHDTYACLAETYLFAREGLREHSVGRPSVESALSVERLARKHGVLPLPLLPEERPPTTGRRGLVPPQTRSAAERTSAEREVFAMADVAP